MHGGQGPRMHMRRKRSSAPPRRWRRRRRAHAPRGHGHRCGAAHIRTRPSGEGGSAMSDGQAHATSFWLVVRRRCCSSVPASCSTTHGRAADSESTSFLSPTKPALAEPESLGLGSPVSPDGQIAICPASRLAIWLDFAESSRMPLRAGSGAIQIWPSGLEPGHGWHLRRTFCPCSLPAPLRTCLRMLCACAACLLCVYMSHVN